MNKKLTVLMYHGITSKDVQPTEGREVGAELYDVSLENFHDQLQWLKDHGYAVKLLSEKNESFHDHDVVITFDDGELNNFQCACPELKSFGFCAYFFIIAKRVGKPGYMGWDEIKQLQQAGMRVGSHGFSHEILTNLKDTQIEEELLASRKYLQRNLGVEIDTLSIPRGFCSNKIIQMAYDIGYKHIFISDRPKNVTAVCYSRVAVKKGWDLKRFELAMHGRIPKREVVVSAFKKCVTLILRESGYNKLRSLYIQVFK